MTRKAREAQPKGRAATRGDADKPPTDLQERFCQEYIVDLNAAQACLRAGYKTKDPNVQGSRLLAMANIQRRVKELQAGRSARTQVTQDYVLTNLTEVLERCMQRAPVMVGRGEDRQQLTDEQGRDVWEFNSKGALGALKLLGDHMGMYTVRVGNAPGETLQVENVNAIPEEQRAERLASLLAAAGRRAGG